MAANPLIAARVTPDLLNRLEAHINESGKSKSEILTEALVAYLNGFTANGNGSPVSLASKQSAEIVEERIVELEERLAALEELLLEESGYPSQARREPSLTYRGRSPLLRRRAM